MRWRRWGIARGRWRRLQRWGWLGRRWRGQRVLVGRWHLLGLIGRRRLFLRGIIASAILVGWGVGRRGRSGYPLLIALVRSLIADVLGLLAAVLRLAIVARPLGHVAAHLFVCLLARLPRRPAALPYNLQMAGRRGSVAVPWSQVRDPPVVAELLGGIGAISRGVPADALEVRMTRARAFGAARVGGHLVALLHILRRALLLCGGVADAVRHVAAGRGARCADPLVAVGRIATPGSGLGSSAQSQRQRQDRNRNGNNYNLELATAHNETPHTRKACPATG